MRADRDNFRDSETDADWLAEALRQLDSFEHVARAELASLDKPPTGDKAARQREMRRRRRNDDLSQYIRNCLQQVALAREALRLHPTAGKAVYHALMVGVLSQYPNTADVRALRQEKRDNAVETNFKKSAESV